MRRRTNTAPPVVGANADDTFSLRREAQSESWDEAIRAFQDKPLIAQPFVESVVSTGEYSLFYFGAEFSHAILKSSNDGDFRVQEEHGGQIQSIHVAEDMRRAGQVAIEAIGEQLLYARVDLVRLADGSPALMELELIEPSLYFNYDQKSPGRFASALDQMVADASVSRDGEPPAPTLNSKP